MKIQIPAENLRTPSEILKLQAKRECEWEWLDRGWT